MLLLMLATGCTTLTASFSQEIKFGQLKGAQDVLYRASKMCPDEAAFTNIKFWTEKGMNETRRIGGRFKEGSPEYLEAVLLVNQLGLVLHSRDTAEKCKHIHAAYLKTNAFINRLIKQPELLAMN